MTAGFAAFLNRLGMGSIYQLLSENDIDETVIRDLDDADLRELGLNIGQRKKLLKALASFDDAQRDPARSVAERRQITVAFCDLVGSTKLAVELDVEAMRDVISSYHSTCQSVMKAHGGHIAYTQGDGLMVYFGYPVAHEDEAAFAVRAGLATVEAVSKLETAVGHGLSVRVGIATGIVVVGDLIGDANSQKDFVVGEAPNLASRLQGLAAPGEVVIAQETRDLAGREFIFAHMGTPHMKALPKVRMSTGSWRRAVCKAALMRARQIPWGR